MNRPRLIRGLRIVWTAVFGVFCVLLVVLWVRSYSYMDQLGGRLSATRILLVGSMRGGVMVQGLPHDWEYSWNIQSWYQVQPGVSLSPFRFGSEIRIVPHGFQVPHWMLVASSIFVGLIPWIHWSKRFSLRILLIAITIVAVVLGNVEWRAG